MLTLRGCYIGQRDYTCNKFFGLLFHGKISGSTLHVGNARLNINFDLRDARHVKSTVFGSIF